MSADAMSYQSPPRRTLGTIRAVAATVLAGIAGGLMLLVLILQRYVAEIEDGER